MPSTHTLVRRPSPRSSPSRGSSAYIRSARANLPKPKEIMRDSGGTIDHPSQRHKMSLLVNAYQAPRLASELGARRHRSRERLLVALIAVAPFGTPPEHVVQHRRQQASKPTGRRLVRAFGPLRLLSRRNRPKFPMTVLCRAQHLVAGKRRAHYLATTPEPTPTAEGTGSDRRAARVRPGGARQSRLARRRRRPEHAENGRRPRALTRPRERPRRGPSRFRPDRAGRARCQASRRRAR